MEIHFLGTGDAFCSGGRNQTCILVEQGGYRVLLDCGATSLRAMKAQDISTNSIASIILSHFHGDHFGGLPYFLLEAYFIENRTHPLTIVGPAGVREQVLNLTELVYPGVDVNQFTYEVVFREFQDQALTLDGMEITAIPVVHTPEALPHGVKLKMGERLLAFSGDSGWTENLIAIAANADLFICECNFFQTELPTHLSYKTIEQQLPKFSCQQIILNHLGPEMLANLKQCSLPLAHDNMKISL